VATPAPHRHGADAPDAVPAGVRAVAGLGAVLATLGTANAAVILTGEGLPVTAVVAVLVLVPAVLALTAVAVEPETSRRRIRARTGADVARPRHALAAGLAAAAFLVVFGLGSILETAYGLENLLVHGKSLSDLTQFTEGGVLRSVGLNLVLFLIPPAVWTLWVDDDTLEAARDRLALRVGDPLRGVGWAVGLLLGSFLVLGLLAGAFRLAGIQPPDNQRALELGRTLTIPSAFAVSVAAATGEELFFRGWLQSKIGNLPQTLLFSLAHFSYLNVLQGIVTLALGYAFGVARNRTDSLLAPGLAHFGFNFVTFVAIMHA
jgi:membrane protease YdiL (CAAX protease family)